MISFYTFVCWLDVTNFSLSRLVFIVAYQRTQICTKTHMSSYVCMCFPYSHIIRILIHNLILQSTQNGPRLNKYRYKRFKIRIKYAMNPLKKVSLRNDWSGGRLLFLPDNTLNKNILRLFLTMHDELVWTR